MELPTADALVSDPPYGINNGNIDGRNVPFHTRSNATKASDNYHVSGDDKPFEPARWLGYKTVILWGASHYCQTLPHSRQWLIWDKRCGCTSDNQADCEIAWTNQNAPARLFSHKWRGMIKDSERDQKRLHPTQKPVALMMWSIQQTKIKKGDTILDPYMGSGTTGIAAARVGLYFIGIERDAAHYKTACDRIAHELDGALL